MARRKLKETRIWTRLEGDTPRPWAVFEFFRDHPHPRPAIKDLAARYGVVEHTVYEWSHAFCWKERIAAYDRHLDNISLKQAERLAKSSTRRHLRAAQAAQELGYEQLREILARARQAAGGAILSAKDALRLVEHGAKLERLVNGEATERVGEEIDFSKYTDAELEELTALLAKGKRV